MRDIDQTLLDDDISFLRYNDDFRVFCRTELQAKLALKRINQLLTAKGLNLQSAKTEIMPAKDAKEMFRGPQLKIRSISKRIIPALRATPTDLVTITLVAPAPPPPPVEDQVSKEALEQAYGELQDSVEVDAKTWNKNLFHYCCHLWAKSNRTLQPRSA